MPNLWEADASLLVSTWGSVSDWSDALWNSRPASSLVPMETCRNCPHWWLLCSRSVDARLFAWAVCTSYSAHSATCLSYVHHPFCLLCYLAEICVPATLLTLLLARAMCTSHSAHSTTCQSCAHQPLCFICYRYFPELFAPATLLTLLLA
jgi:hypothetical protein